MTRNSLLSFNAAPPAVQVIVATSPEQMVINAILQSNADVCLLQETHRGWNALFAACATLAERYPHTFNTGDAFMTGGFTLLARAAITDVRLVEPGSNVPGSLFPAISFSCGGIRYISVHL